MVRSHTKFGPDRFSRFDVILDTNGQTNKQIDFPFLLTYANIMHFLKNYLTYKLDELDRQAKYIYIDRYKIDEMQNIHKNIL